MNPLDKGFDRLLNPNDRMKITNINKHISDFLKEITAEENDIAAGYISGSNTVKVASSDNFPNFQN
jgi:hypothetical protein